MIAEVLITRERRLVPASQSDAHRLMAVPAGMSLPLRVDLARDRGRFNRFMALVAFVAANHPTFTVEDDVLRWLKIRTGHCHEHITVSGRSMYELRGIGFRDLDDGEFAEWSARARQIIFAELFPTLSEADGMTIEQLYSWV